MHAKALDSASSVTHTSSGPGTGPEATKNTRILKTKPSEAPPEVGEGTRTEKYYGIPLADLKNC